MDIRILGAHNCETAASSYVSIIIDGKIALEAGGLTSRLTIEEQEKIDAVIITHNHMDHIRDIPGIALNSYRRGTSIDIYSTAHTCDTIKEHLLNQEIYPEFQNIPETKPTVCFQEIEPLGLQWIDGHAILPIPVNHHGNAVGYQVGDKQDKKIFFTGDTGPGLAACWQYTSPQLLIIDVTMRNEYEEFARATGHLTPRLLEEELVSFKNLKRYIPDVLAIHMDLAQEDTIREQLNAVGERLHTAIGMAHENMCLTL